MCQPSKDPGHLHLCSLPLLSVAAEIQLTVASGLLLQQDFSGAPVPASAATQGSRRLPSLGRLALPAVPIMLHPSRQGLSSERAS